MKRLFAMTLVLTLSLLGDGQASTPQLVNYQGLLVDNLGVQVADGSYSVTFTIYDAATSGASVWSETQSVNTIGGLFAVLLGSLNPIEDTVFRSAPRFLGLKVGADPELAPRMMLVTVPWTFRVSTVDGASGGNITSKVSIGAGHTNTGTDAFVAGRNNTSSGIMSTVGGGYGNNASLDYTTISGGSSNTTSGGFASVGGGSVNTASAIKASVGGGGQNTSSGYSSRVGGGDHNLASGTNATVAGGSNDTAKANYATVGGGYLNVAEGTYSTISGGHKQLANGYYSSIGGGSLDTTLATYGGVSAGYHNVAGDEADDTAAFIGGGSDNKATGKWATVGGGANNYARGNYSVVGGGGGSTPFDSNSASGLWSTVGGGIRNRASGPLSTVPGGSTNEASGQYSFAAGWKAKAMHSGSFVWSHYNPSGSPQNFNSTASNQFLIRAFGGVGINTNSPSEPLEVNGKIKSSWGGFVFPDNTIQSSAAKGAVPIGSVVSWLKSYPSTPVLPDGFVECNGQTLVDANSLYNGQTIPDLNSGRFLRGSATSGGTGGSNSHKHTVTIPASPNGAAVPTWAVGAAGNVSTTSSSNIPPYYAVVWIMRIK